MKWRQTKCSQSQVLHVQTWHILEVHVMITPQLEGIFEVYVLVTLGLLYKHFQELKAFKEGYFKQKMTESS